MAELKIPSRSALHKRLIRLSATLDLAASAPDKSYAKDFHLDTASKLRDELAAIIFLGDDAPDYVSREAEFMDFRGMSDAVTIALESRRGSSIGSRVDAADRELARISGLIRGSLAERRADRRDAIVKLYREAVESKLAAGEAFKSAEVFKAAREAVDGPKAKTGTAKAKTAPKVRA